MTTTLYRVPAGTTSPVFPLLANQNLCVAPNVLGGSASILVGSNPSGPFSSVGGSLTTAQSYRPDTNVYAQIQASSQLAIGVQSDMVIPNMQGPLVSNQAAMASANSTSEQVLFSFRLAPNSLPANFRCRMNATANMTNSAGAKTMNCRMNGLAGNLFFASPALANQANYNFIAQFSGLGDAATLEGWGSGTTGGLGPSTTAYTTLTRAYQQLETEVVITCTKATGTEVLELSSLNVILD